jgi:hypothetical protein
VLQYHTFNRVPSVRLRMKGPNRPLHSTEHATVPPITVPTAPFYSTAVEYSTFPLGLLFCMPQFSAVVPHCRGYASLGSISSAVEGKLQSTVDDSCSSQSTPSNYDGTVEIWANSSHCSSSQFCSLRERI